VERDQDHVLLRGPGHPITVREILSHTSGLPFSSAMEQPTLDLLPLREATASYAMTALDFGPGSKYQYSNAGINTAGRIIEVVTGQRFESFLDQRLLGPLGMKDTTFWPNTRQVARLATSYKPSADGKGLEAATITQLRYPLSDRTRQPMPAGGLFSTAADVARFCRMILRGGELDGRKYLSESAVHEMTRRQTPLEISESYGLGWRVAPDGFGHGGAYSTDMTIDAARGRVLVYLVQHVGFAADGEKCLPAFMAAARV
jgi:CubicO group peptidase (beta-lactamase class C family)